MDGLGWLVEKRARLMKTFGWSWERVVYEVPCAEGWVWFAWSLENERTAFGNLHKRTTDGYVRQEINRLMAMVKKR